MQTYLHSYTCQSIAFDSSMFWPRSADTKCTSTSTLMHSAQSLFLSSKLLWAVVCHLVAFLWRYIRTMPKTRSLRTDEENFPFKYWNGNRSESAKNTARICKVHTFIVGTGSLQTNKKKTIIVMLIYVNVCLFASCKFAINCWHRGYPWY